MTQTGPYQGMSRAVVAELLALAAAYDRKFVVEDPDVLAFHDTAVEFRWTSHEAEQAIRKWGREEAHTGWLSAAKLNAMIRAKRQDDRMRELPPAASPFAERTVRERIMATWAEARAESKIESGARKAAIARHPDLVEKFNAIGFMRFEVWNGWIAPATVPSASAGGTSSTTDLGTGFKVNTSPIRAAVLEIALEAERREAS